MEEWRITIQVKKRAINDDTKYWGKTERPHFGGKSTPHPKRIAPRCARRVGRSGSTSLKKRQKTAQKPEKMAPDPPSGGKRGSVAGCSYSVPTQKGQSFFPPRFAWRVGRSGQTESEMRKIVREGRSVRDAEPTLLFASPVLSKHHSTLGRLPARSSRLIAKQRSVVTAI